MLERGIGRALVFTTASGAGGDVVVLLRPPVGELWDLYQAHAYHDDVARTMGWTVYDAIGPVSWLGPAYAARLYSLWTEDNGSPVVPLRLHHDYYLGITVVGMAAAKNAYLAGLIERIVGVGTVQGA